MTSPSYGAGYAGSMAEQYERTFVPAIGGPVAEDLVAAAALRPGERVLDVACGTGVVTRLAAEAVGSAGTVAGLDLNPDMIGVARSGPHGADIRWHVAPAESMPLPDEGFDVVLCQMGLQFMDDRPAALSEMRRVLAPGGRLLLNLPGPIPAPMGVLAEGLTDHLDPEAAGFVHRVFSIHDQDEIRGLLADAGFEAVKVEAVPKALTLPPPKDFLWQYVSSTPVSGRLAQAGSETLEGLERDVCAGWAPWVEGGHLALTVRMSTAYGRRPG